MKKVLIILALAASSCTNPGYKLVTSCDGVVTMETTPDNRPSYELDITRKARKASDKGCDVILMLGQDTIYAKIRGQMPSPESQNVRRGL